MSDPQGVAFWPGVRALMSASYTMTPGISPNTATLVIPPQTGRIAQAGTLSWIYGRMRFDLRQCALDAITETTDGSGHTRWELTILDRRWQWRDTGRISGFYNVRKGGRIKAGTEKTPQALAKLCLEAMGERHANVTALAGLKTRPEIDWDYTNPASALADLCDRLGVMVVLGLDNRVYLWRDGEGQRLPTYPILDGALAVDPPEPPERIVMVGGRTRWQADLDIEAVGLDKGGAIKPINELSYAPRWAQTGQVDWRFVDTKNYQGLIKPEFREFAKQSVFRWYRVKTPIKLPGTKDEIKDLSRILPLETSQVETWTLNGETESRPPWVYGIWSPGRSSYTDSTEQIEGDVTNKPRGLYGRGFQLDPETGIVRFNEPVLRFIQNDGNLPANATATGRLVYPAKLRLRVAVNLRDEETRGWLREEFDRKPKEKPKTNKRTRYVQRDDLTREVYHRFERPAKLIDNLEDVKKLASDYLTAELLKYQTRKAGSLSFAGFMPIPCDGMVRQVTWSVGEDGRATTRVSQNREELFVAPAYRERRLIEDVQRLIQEKNKPARQLAEDLHKRRG